MNLNHKRALVVMSSAVVLDTLLGLLFSVAQHVAWYTGLYFATTTATTVGYGDVTPHGWAAHVIALVMMLTVIPLFAATFSLITTGLTSTHIDKRHEEMKRHVTTTLGSNGGND